MPTLNKDSTKMLTPEGLVEQLFNGVLQQNLANPKQAAGQVIAFLSKALFYAITSSKNDPVVFLTETLILAASSSAEDETARKELLKYIADMISNAPPIMGGPSGATGGTAASAGTPAGVVGSPLVAGGKPVVGKP